MLNMEAIMPDDGKAAYHTPRNSSVKTRVAFNEKIGKLSVLLDFWWIFNTRQRE